MVNWKVLAGFAGFAMLISMITGIFSGVGLGDLLLRMLIWGVLFAVLGVGILAAINRFLPELAAAFSGNPVPEKSETGEEVDIILPDENPHEFNEETDLYDGVLDDDNSGSLGENFSKKTIAEEVDSSLRKPPASGDDDLEALEEIGDDPFIETDDLDSLPDLEKFSGSFSSFEDLDKSNTDEGPVFKPKENVDISGVKQDPAKVAKALHTWIARDKEG